MSGSFQWPGPAYVSWPFWPKPMPDMLPQVSVMSPVVRQQLPPTSWPHFQTSPMPYWQRLKTMSRLHWSRAARITGVRLHQARQIGMQVRRSP